MGRINLAATASFQVNSSGVSGTSPRSGARDVLSMARKFRTPSRQSQGSRMGRKQPKGSDLLMFGDTSFATPSRPYNTQSNGGASAAPNESGLLPQIRNVAYTSFGQPSSQKRGAGGVSPSEQPPPSLFAYPHPARDHNAQSLAMCSEEGLHSAVTSIKGLKPGNPAWTNQDNFFLLELPDRDLRVYCVLDGHGEHGHIVSKRCRENFPHFLKSTNWQVEAAFNMMQNDLTSSEIDVRCSGATCVIACVSNNRLTVYNCGDSRAVLGRRSASGAIAAYPLSNDHKPDKPEERKRILGCGGHLGCRQVLVNQGNRGPVSMPVGPCRVWYQHRGETLGLAMSRSLGDSIVHKVGVTAEPELTEHQIDDHDEFIILATDGVWDVVDNNHAVQMVFGVASRSVNWSVLEASNAVCRFARSRWEKLSPMVDDITCVVVKIHR
ncbi:protein serine/threonine phosphatase 2C family protein [archaeon]|nr:MAG: protein serine/threonine phosphatase 2C family protein [archaeon]